jgi:hypothetical protein
LAYTDTWRLVWARLGDAYKALKDWSRFH